MALDNYADLQTAVLNWLARPGDTLISPSVPDMITLFETEARRRMRTRFNEVTVTLTTTPNVETVALPADFYQYRRLAINNGDDIFTLVYMSPDELDDAFPETETDQPQNFTIEGTNLRLRPVSDQAYSIILDYMQGLPALSNSNTTNWLLTNEPDAYLFGTLAEAEAFIGHDERVPMWIQRREATFNSILASDRAARWGGMALQIKTDTGNP